MHDFSKLRERLLAVLPYVAGTAHMACAPQATPAAEGLPEASAVAPEVAAADSAPELAATGLDGTASDVDGGMQLDQVDAAETLAEVAQPKADCDDQSGVKVCYTAAQLKGMVHGGYTCKPHSGDADAGPPGTESCTTGPYSGPMPPAGCPAPQALMTCCAGNCCNSVCEQAPAGDTCCYTFGQGCQCGRPFEVGGQIRTASWSRAANQAETRPCFSGAVESRMARAWRADASAEYASVASFLRYALEMLQVGAPAQLVADALAAASDEIDHATTCLAIAARLDGRTCGDGVVDSAGLAIRSTLAEIAAAAVREGCIGETLAASHLARAAAGITDNELRSLVQRMADDELRHAGIAWRFVAWVLTRQDATATAAVAAEFARVSPVEAGSSASAEVGAGSESLAAWGRLTEREARACAAAAMAQIVMPCARKLLVDMAMHGAHPAVEVA